MLIAELLEKGTHCQEEESALNNPPCDLSKFERHFQRSLQCFLDESDLGLLFCYFISAFLFVSEFLALTFTFKRIVKPYLSVYTHFRYF